jgi:hypothetical protein
MNYRHHFQLNTLFVPQKFHCRLFPREFDLFAAFRGVNKFTFLHWSAKVLATKINYGGDNVDN